MAFKIYTKTGDAGETGLFGGKRLPKHHLRIEAYGTVDELNACLGLVRDHLTTETELQTLKAIQDRLFTIGANLASEPDKNMSLPDIRTTDITLLEQEMDRIDKTLEPLRNFILPGGHPAVSHAHLARTVCRRTERRVTELAEQELVAPIIIQYLNRLSDYLFVLGRLLAKQYEVKEIAWHARKD